MIVKVTIQFFLRQFFLAFIIILTTTGFVYGQSQEGDLIRIGFWNIRDFSDNSRDCTEIALIASIAHKMDCLAIAELNDEVVLPKLVYALELSSKGTIKSSEKGNPAVSPTIRRLLLLVRQFRRNVVDPWLSVPGSHLVWPFLLVRTDRLY